MLAFIKYKYQNLITFKYKKSVSVFGVYLIKDLFAFGLSTTQSSCAFGPYSLLILALLGIIWPLIEKNSALVCFSA